MPGASPSLKGRSGSAGTTAIDFSSSDNWFRLEYEDYDPTGQPNPNGNPLFAPTGASDAIEAHAFWRLLDGNYNGGQNRLEAIGVDTSVIQGLADWADSVWTHPDTDWYTW